MLTENMASADDQTERYAPRVSYLRGMAVVLVGFVALLTTFAWWNAKQSAEEHFQQLFAAQADATVREVSLELQSRIGAIERMARRWETAGGTPRELLEADAATMSMIFQASRPLL
jgi:sensor domain CHASE-containing protein